MTSYLEAGSHRGIRYGTLVRSLRGARVNLALLGPYILRRRNSLPRYRHFRLGVPLVAPCVPRMYSLGHSPDLATTYLPESLSARKIMRLLVAIDLTEEISKGLLRISPKSADPHAASRNGVMPLGP